MSSAAVTTPDRMAQAEAGPVDDFSRCHEGIISGLAEFALLPELQEAAQHAKTVATHVLNLLDHAVTEHHKDEEEELFSAVIRSARPGAEVERVKFLVNQLTEEHRAIEDLWRRLRPEVQHAAAGKPARLRPDAVNLLVEVYGRHAELEESDFLPLARDILSRNGNHMAALGMALHLRHTSVPIGYL